MEKGTVKRKTAVQSALIYCSETAELNQSLWSGGHAKVLVSQDYRSTRSLFTKAVRLLDSASETYSE